MKTSITKEFVLAGNAIFTVANNKGEWHTFRVRKGKSVYFASILAGPDNERSYRDVCRITDDGICTNEFDEWASKILQWAIRRIWLQDSLPEGYSIKHAGRCGRCGRLLTTPDSIEIGIGPECRLKI